MPNLPFAAARRPSEIWSGALGAANALNLELTPANRAALAALWEPLPARPGLFARLAAMLRAVPKRRPAPTAAAY